MYKKLERWVGHEFESSTIRTEEYIAFEKDFLGTIKKELRERGIEYVNVGKSHFQCSCIVQNTNTQKYAYFSISDVRFWQDEWSYKILYRTCEGPKDYTGGHNNYCDVESLVNNLERITK